MAVESAEFDFAKALEAVLFVVRRTPTPTYHKIAKVFYAADKAHLSRYGRLMLDDRYCAMRDGPVPSNIYDLLKFAAGRETEVHTKRMPALRRLADLPQSLQLHWGLTFTANRDGNTHVLSDSEVECLLESIKENGHKSWFTLRKESHDEAWEATGLNDPIALDDVVKTLPNAKAVQNHLSS